jgi:hypothetical protein
MPSFAILLLTLLVPAMLAIPSGGWAQTRVRTETIRPPTADDADVTRTIPAKPADGETSPAPDTPEVMRDLSALPPAVARMRERILSAAHSGDLQKLAAVMQDGKTMPAFSFSDETDPVSFWKASYPDSDGVEVLSILSEILEAPYVHVDRGTPQEMYLWPYFTRMPLKELSPAQQVELFRIVTGADYRDMIEFGAYSFYRLGIGPDGAWHFFIAGD